MSVSNTTLAILFLLIPDNRTNNRGERDRERLQWVYCLGLCNVKGWRGEIAFGPLLPASSPPEEKDL